SRKWSHYPVRSACTFARNLQALRCLISVGNLVINITQPFCIRLTKFSRWLKGIETWPNRFKYSWTPSSRNVKTDVDLLWKSDGDNKVTVGSQRGTPVLHKRIPG